MIRIKGNTHSEIVSMDNLIAADILSRAHMNPESSRLARWDANWWNNIARLYDELHYFAYNLSGYYTFMTCPDRYGKIRKITACQDHRDCVVQQAVVQVLYQEFISKFIFNTFSSIPGRGPHPAIMRIKRIMKLPDQDLYALQLDICKFYPNINNDILKDQLRRVIKCRKTIWLTDAIIDSYPGLPIGNRTSPWFGNLHLNDLDHLIEEQWGADYYIRYCDNLILIDRDQSHLNWLVGKIVDYIENHLKLKIHLNWAVFRIADRKRAGRGLDFLGFVFYRKHTDMRKITKLRWRRRLRALNRAKRAKASKYDLQAWGSLNSILKYCDSKNLLKTFKYDYPRYFERLQQYKAAKAAVAKRKKAIMADVLQSSRNA
ncbi:MAG: RNA-directed DNA polymerase [Mangrovibacterium sp.]